MKRKTKRTSKSPPVYDRIRQILETARTNVARSVNTTQVVSYWLIGREIVEEEQKGKLRADYGRQLIEGLSKRITKDFGAGYSIQSLFYMVQFYRSYPKLLSSSTILHAVRGELSDSRGQAALPILHALRGESGREIPHALSRKTVAGDASAIIGYAVRSQSGIISRNMAGRIRHAVRDEFSEPCENSEAVRRKSEITPTQGKQPNQHAVRVESSVAVILPAIGHAPRGQSWQTGQLHPDLSWTRYGKGVRQSKTGGGA